MIGVASSLVISGIVLSACGSEHTVGMPPPGTPINGYAARSTTPIPGVGVAPSSAAPATKKVLVIVNRNDPAGIEIAKYYAEKRKISTANIFPVDISSIEECSTSEFDVSVKLPLLDYLRKHTEIEYVVMTKGVPIRLGSGIGYSTDGVIAGMFLTGVKPIPELLDAKANDDDDMITDARNPYLGAIEHFSRVKYNMVLVTRLDGYTVGDVKKMIDNSINAKPVKGPFFFDSAANRGSGGYALMQNTLDAAYTVLKKKGLNSVLDTNETFVGYPAPMAGYCSWGSNDGKFSLDAYHKLRFLPGALAETFVSTSGRTFKPTTGGQSLIADLIAQGVTGVKGYVSEPYTFALAQPQILFDRYTAGFNLAESFYAASPVIKWKDVIIGDPLCSPYSK